MIYAMVVLGIESSCDETAASVVKDGKVLLSNVIATSMDLHVAFGGVVPEIAARSHIESIIPVIEQALAQAFPREKSNKTADLRDKIDAIAVTCGPGLGGSLLVGVMTARTLAVLKNKPLYGINHVEAHAYVNFLTDSKIPDYHIPTTRPQFPLLALIVSGGHTQLVLFKNHFDYVLLGQTRDDAIGEAFDKVAKVIGLPYPGGPSIAKAALKGNPKKYKLPKAKLTGISEDLAKLRTIKAATNTDNTNHTVKKTDTVSGYCYDFSFSGPKTAVLRLAQEEIGKDYTYPSFKIAESLSEVQKNDIAASFQYTAIQTVVDKTVQSYHEFNPKSVIIGGGVSANQELRRQLTERIPIKIQYPDIKLCTDNAAMIATLGCYKAMLNQQTADPYSLQIDPNLSM